MKNIPTRQVSGHLCSYGSMYGQLIQVYMGVQDVLLQENRQLLSLWATNLF